MSNAFLRMSAKDSNGGEAAFAAASCLSALHSIVDSLRSNVPLLL